MKALLTGNEAIARGCYEANVWVATGYPGTPSSEVITTISTLYPEIDSEWSINEKVALEIAIGASLGGVRSIATMKHVGLNVAADALMTLSYTGVNAGLVIYVADDPGMHSSQNEQDTRNYAKFAKIPLFEPMDSNEAKNFTKIAFEISENFDTPVIVRGVTRVAHSKSIVSLQEPKRSKPEYKYKKNVAKYTMMPLYAIPKHPFIIERYKKLRTFSENFNGHIEEYNSYETGIITHGLIYNYVKEVFPQASIFKIGMYPIPLERLREFASKVKKLYVIEELDPVIEEELKASGFNLTGKELIPITGELLPDRIRKAFGINTQNYYPQELPPRPPVLCKGCGHIPVFEVLKELNVTVMGDIGCYTLGALPPYDSMDTTICMGASIGMEEGLKKVQKLSNKNTPSLAVIGDSTFFHSGLPHLLNAVYNNIPIKLIILDNRITAMTGHQPTVSTGLNNKFQSTTQIDLENLIRGFGVKRVRKVNPYKKEELKKIIQEELGINEISVIIADEICIIGENIIKKFKNQ
jgi:indolepyruvate ferredoxin oxidoreductase alpha subunit